MYKQQDMFSLYALVILDLWHVVLTTPNLSQIWGKLYPRLSCTQFIPQVNKHGSKPPYFLTSHPLPPCSHPFFSHASFLLFHLSLTFFLLEMNKGVAVYEKSDSMEYSNQVWAPRRVLHGTVCFRCFGKEGWRNGWKCVSWVARTPPSSFHPSVASLTPQSLSSVFGAQLHLWFITFRRAWASQTTSTQHGASGRCLFSYFNHSYSI